VRHLLIPCLVICVVVLGGVVGVLGDDDAVAVPPIIPPSDTGVGLFYDIGWMGRIEEGGRSPEAVRKHFREMVAAGCNTLTLYAYNVEETAMQMDIAIEEGLVERFPVFMLTNNIDAEKSPYKFVQSAKAVSEHRAQWPEIIFYGPDEIEGGNQERMADLAETIHAEGMRLGLTTYAPLDYAGIADIIVPLAYACTEEVRTGIRAAGSEFWAYEVGPFHRSTNYHLPRFIAGLWRWKVRPDVFLGWSYMDCRGDTPVIRGMRDGCMDYRVLRALEEALAKQDNPEAREWLEKLRADIPWNPYTGIPPRAPRYALPYLNIEVGIPKMANFDLYRQWAGYYLSELTGCDQVW